MWLTRPLYQASSLLLMRPRMVVLSTYLMMVFSWVEMQSCVYSLVSETAALWGSCDDYLLSHLHHRLSVRRSRIHLEVGVGTTRSDSFFLSLPGWIEPNCHPRKASSLMFCCCQVAFFFISVMHTVVASMTQELADSDIADWS